MLRASLVALIALAAACSEPAKLPAPAPAKAPAKTEPEPAKTEPAKTEPAKTEPARPAVCEAAAAPLAALRSAAPGAPIAYAGTPVQAWIVAGDAELGRTDDAAITASLAVTTPAGTEYTRALIEAAIAQWFRGQLKKAAEGQDDRAGAWAAARCAWDVALAPLAHDPAVAASDPGLAAHVDAAFAAGAAADPTKYDAAFMPGHEVVEKSWFRVVHRRLLHAASAAKTAGDAAAAARALGIFEALRDRLKDRNTPGIDLIVAELKKPDPKQIDPDRIERELAVAIVKRANKYCTEAVDPASGKTLGTPAAAATAAEGLAYTEILLPDMTRKLADQRFDRNAHVEAWNSFAHAIDEKDEGEAKRISAELVQWNCAYQRALGIRECTGNVDEVAAAAR